MNDIDTKHNWRYEKILSLEEAAVKMADLKASGKKIVSANGSFDLLQAGHLDFLEEAAEQGDVLIVGINTDRRVKEKKGDLRPIISQENRAALLAALICVDFVTFIDGGYDDEPHESFLPAIQSDVHANNLDDYGDHTDWIEWPKMQELGIEPYGVRRRPNLSTSEIVEKIRKGCT